MRFERMLSVGVPIHRVVEEINARRDQTEQQESTNCPQHQIRVTDFGGENQRCKDKPVLDPLLRERRYQQIRRKRRRLLRRGGLRYALVQHGAREGFPAGSLRHPISDIRGGATVKY